MEPLSLHNHIVYVVESLSGGGYIEHLLDIENLSGDTYNIRMKICKSWVHGKFLKTTRVVKDGDFLVYLYIV